MERDKERPESGPEDERSLEEPTESAGAAEPTETGVGEGETPAQPGVEPAAEPAEARAGEGETPVQPGVQPAAEPTEAGAGEGETRAQPGVEPAAERPEGELRRYVLTAAVSAGVLLFALAFFLAGFWVHAQLDDDQGGDGTAASASAGASDDPAWGPEDALVIIEEFADFQCPYCRSFADETLPKIREAYGDRVRYVYRDFPLTSIHQFAQKAAEAAQCAHEQGQFWEYHDLLFANQEALAVSDLKEYAQQAGLDTGEFDECLDSGKNSQEVSLDMQDGRQAGVNGTPAFLINGLLVAGAQPFERFQAVIDQALAEAGG